MTGLQRLWVCVVLQAVAEQDEKYVVTELGAGRTVARFLKKKSLARETRDFVASPEFERVCNLAGLPVDDMRRLSPDEAAQAFFRFQRGEYDRSENALEPEPNEPPLEREPRPEELVALELEVEV
jgi:hypothetical protein